MATTIKVSTELRDRLRREADRDGLTLGGLLEDLLAERARARRFDDLRASLAASPPDADYAAELREWDATLDDGPTA